MILARIRERDGNGKPYMQGQLLCDVKAGTVVTLRRCERGGLYDGPEGYFVIVGVQARGPTFPRTCEQSLLAFTD